MLISFISQINRFNKHKKPPSLEHLISDNLHELVAPVNKLYMFHVVIFVIHLQIKFYLLWKKILNAFKKKT